MSRADDLLRWYADVARPLPWRATRDPYALLVSEVMLQQTQAARVVPRYEAFLARFPDVGALASAPARDVLAAWSGLGTLAIAAARLGWAPVAGVDRMAGAVEAARANGARNGVDVAWGVADLERDPVPLARLVLVNAPPPVQARMAAAADATVAAVIVSGMLLPELRDAMPAYAAAGLAPVRALEHDGWAAARLERSHA